MCSLYDEDRRLCYLQDVEGLLFGLKNMEGTGGG